MPDLETVLVAVYVLAAEFCAAEPPEPPRPGPIPALTPAEVLTLATLAAHTHHQSERAFWRFADLRLRSAFPTLPSRPQFNRQRRRLADLTARFALTLGDPVERVHAPYEVLDGAALPVRSVKRRGRSWLAGLVDRGWSTRLGWYYGARLLLSVTPSGTITGFGLGTASCPERHLADTFLAARAGLLTGLPGIGRPAAGAYLADGGFAGRACQARWRDEAGAVVHAPPHPASRDRWPADGRRWLASRRQIVETVIGQVVGADGLERSRAHTRDGLRARVAGGVSWHNVGIWLNRWLGRPALTHLEIRGWDL